MEPLGKPQQNLFGWSPDNPLINDIRNCSNLRLHSLYQNVIPRCKIWQCWPPPQMFSLFFLKLVGVKVIICWYLESFTYCISQPVFHWKLNFHVWNQEGQSFDLGTFSNMKTFLELFLCSTYHHLNQILLFVLKHLISVYR